MPEAYSAALSLSEQGLSEDDMAERLAVPRESVAPLLRIARAKLARLLSTDTPRHEPVSSEPSPGGMP